ncbi:MAG: hypothetical protein SVV80_04920 [Planctomycetota bacterium]|nr:hypothetical protein [Planctomycetota bacterium]
MNIEHLQPDEEEFFFFLGESVLQEESDWIKFSTIAKKLGIEEKSVKAIAITLYDGGIQRGGKYELDYDGTHVMPTTHCIELARIIQAKRRRKPDYFARAIATARSNRWIAGFLLVAIFIGWLIGVVGGILAIFRQIMVNKQ